MMESIMAAQNAQSQGWFARFAPPFALTLLSVILVVWTFFGVFSCLDWTANKAVDIKTRKTLAAGQLETGVRAEPPDRITRLERRVEYESHRAHKRIDALYKHLWDEHMRELKKRLPPPPEKEQP